MKDSNQQKAGVQLPLIAKKRKEMSSAERVQMYQRKLYLKAKQEKGYRFYLLYDKIFLPFMLKEAWERVKANGGSAGVDGQTFEEIEKAGVDEFLMTLSEGLRRQTYQASAVKRVWIPKSNGGKRPLGIPTIKDRVAQMACKMVIEPIFEADFEDSSYGFRPKRSGQEAIAKIREHLQSGKTEVYDADLSNYFDTIPHEKLKIALEERIAEKRVLKLINKWLKAPIYEEGQFKGGKTNREGVPQGGVISPLLSNLYLHLLDRIVSYSKGLFKRLGIVMVRYADDFVLMGKTLGRAAIEKMKGLLARMGLKLNEEKSTQIDAREKPFHFLGFVIRYDRSFKNPQSGKFWNVKPSEKSNKKIREKIGATLQRMGHYRVDTLKYFNRKSQRKSRLYRKQAFELLVSKFGLIDPIKYQPTT